MHSRVSRVTLLYGRRAPSPWGEGGESGEKSRAACCGFYPVKGALSARLSRPLTDRHKNTMSHGATVYAVAPCLLSVCTGLLCRCVYYTGYRRIFAACEAERAGGKMRLHPPPHRSAARPLGHAQNSTPCAAQGAGAGRAD